MTQGILGVSRGFESSSYGTTVASCRDRGNPRHLLTYPVKKLVYWCEFRRGPRVAPSETLYNLRRCYPKPMPCREGRKAIYSTSTTAAEAKKEARAVVERVARLC